jgi:hypothetical protein
MPINWFEGGRRITWLLMAIPAMIGGYIAYDHPSARVELWTASLADGWHLSSSTRDENEFGEGAAIECHRSEILWEFQIKPGLVKDIRLCFTGGQTDAQTAEDLAERANFDITGARASGYADAEIAGYLFSKLRIDDDKKRLKDVEISLSRSKGTGDIKKARNFAVEAARLRMRIDQNEQEMKRIMSPNRDPIGAITWEQLRIYAFPGELETIKIIEQKIPIIEREALAVHIKTTLLLTAYWIGGIWIFSFVLGWIVRGFAGVPRGQDFKPDIKK